CCTRPGEGVCTRVGACRTLPKDSVRMRTRSCSTNRRGRRLLCKPRGRRNCGSTLNVQVHFDNVVCCDTCRDRNGSRRTCTTWVVVRPSRTKCRCCHSYSPLSAGNRCARVKGVARERDRIRRVTRSVPERTSDVLVVTNLEVRGVVEGRRVVTSGEQVVLEHEVRTCTRVVGDEDGTVTQK